MDLQQIGRRDLSCLAGQLDGGLHRGDVAEDLDRDTVGRFATLCQESFSFDQTTGSGVETLDLRRRHRFGPKQEPCQALETDMGRSGLVEVPDRDLGIGEVGGQIPGQAQIPTCERIWQVGVVAAALPITACHASEAGLPPSVEKFGHPSAPIPLSKGCVASLAYIGRNPRELE